MFCFDELNLTPQRQKVGSSSRRQDLHFESVTVRHGRPFPQHDVINVLVSCIT